MKWLLVIPLLLLGLGVQAGDDLFLAPQFDVGVEKDVIYGEGIVDSTSKPRSRKLLMDVYRPVGDAVPAKRPALVLAFGGFWHRGGKDVPPRADSLGHSMTPMSGYCRAFAARGYTCFSIDYRLTQEDPGLEALPHADLLMDPNIAVDLKYLDGANQVRKEEGMAPLTNENRMWFWRAIVGSAEDMGKAVAYVRTNADQFGIDPERLAIGGWSAGAFASINAAFGARVPVKAVVSNSGGFWGYNLYNLPQVKDFAETPALLMFWGENDIPGLLQMAPAILRSFNHAKVDSQLAWVPARGHFYSAEDISLGADGSKQAVLARMVDFLYAELDLQHLN